MTDARPGLFDAPKDGAGTTPFDWRLDHLDYTLRRNLYLASKRPIVLIVEDQIIIASAMRDSLIELGADVVGPCLTLQSALQVATSAKVDAAVLDVWLHGEACYPVADLLMKRGIPFIFTSGVNMGREPREFHQVPRLLKPFSNQELQSALSALWEHETD